MHTEKFNFLETYLLGEDRETNKQMRKCYISNKDDVIEGNWWLL